MNEKKIKVTDKRLFTPDGELREEFRDLENVAATPDAAAEAAAEPATVEAPAGQPTPAESPPAESQSAAERSPTAPAGASPAEPSFLDLVATVAQPIALYLGDVTIPDGESMENLQMARLHIDLLEILQTKSAGNLTDQESGFLEDLLYQLRLRYVEKSGKG